jgi:DNA polymerase-3 subunit epsilon
MKDLTLAFLDVETTGLDPQKHEVIQIGVVLAKQIPRQGNVGPGLEKIEEIDIKIKPERLEDAEEDALRVNGYNDADWMFAPDLKNAMEFLSKKLEGTVQVSHNLTFDSAFMEKCYERAGLENNMARYKLDTISIAFARLYNRPDVKYSLKYLCELFQIKNENAHTALADARALYNVYKKMMNA